MRGVSRRAAARQMVEQRSGPVDEVEDLSLRPLRRPLQHGHLHENITRPTPLRTLASPRHFTKGITAVDFTVNLFGFNLWVPFPETTITAERIEILATGMTCSDKKI